MSPEDLAATKRRNLSPEEFAAWVKTDGELAAQSINDVVTGKIPEDDKTLPPGQWER